MNIGSVWFVAVGAAGIVGHGSFKIFLKAHGRPFFVVSTFVEIEIGVILAQFTFELVVVFIVALPLLAAERWWDSYNRGVKAVNAKQYEVAVQALEAAIAAAPAESSAARVRNAAIVYVPHYWLGVAKFNLGDVDGAVRAWRISEEQGAIAKTEFYPKLREWVSRAQADAGRNGR